MRRRPGGVRAGSMGGIHSRWFSIGSQEILSDGIDEAIDTRGSLRYSNLTVMTKTRWIIALVAVCVALGGALVIQFLKVGRVPQTQVAVESYRANPAALLAHLMHEVYAVGKGETSNHRAAEVKAAHLALAFEVLGKEARSLLPWLEAQFKAGRSLELCVAAFQHVGGTDCGLMLVSGLTNATPSIRDAAMSVISSFATNREVARAAIPPLLNILEDDSAFSRTLAANALGSIWQDPESVVPKLLQVAKHDSDFIARLSAIKAIGRLGTNSEMAKQELEGIAAADPDVVVRRIAFEAIRAANREMTSDAIQ